MPRRRGRRPSTFWVSFTTEMEPFKLRVATCRHCRELVRYHKKWEQARNHLMKCEPFLKVMETLSPAEQPDWYIVELGKREKTAANRVFRGGNGIGSTAGTKTQTSPQVGGKAKVFAVRPPPATTATHTTVKKEASTAKITKKDLKRLEDCVAMHLLLTLPMEVLAEQRFETAYLSQAFQACSRGLVLPDGKRLLSVLLDRCYANVRRRVAKHLAAGPVPVCLSLEASPTSSKDELVMDYTAITSTAGAHAFFLESVHFPSSAHTSANAQWTAHDVARVADTLSCPVAGCVIACAPPESRQSRQLLEHQFPALFFHGCMRDALFTLVHELFVPTAGTADNSSATTSFFPGLQQFALECKDLVGFLPHKDDLVYAREFSSRRGDNVMHVAPTRLLTVEEGLSAILQAEAFLDVNNVALQHFPTISGARGNGGDVAASVFDPAGLTLLQTKLRDLVTSPHFLAKLRKYLAVLRPVHLLLIAFHEDENAPVLPLSEVYPSFSRLAEQYSSSSLLVPEEKVTLQMLVRQQYELVLGPAHLLAYLLDPVYAGQDFPAEMKADVERKLLSSVAADGAPRTEMGKEALYMQYTDFQIAALHQKANNADSFVFRMLKERKKTPLQFWLTDGAKWPELQAAACRVFAMSACVASSRHVFARAGVAPRLLREQLDSRTTEKLAYIRANAKQLQVAEGGGNAQPLRLHDFQDDHDVDDLLAFPATVV
ncbi:hypothetical protein BBJ28_00019590 [Nothophytophthora sp. Chile5]|nr:hypothetical protein BBJ28_00019590 [Nothophytophthora sp. Chile5]